MITFALVLGIIALSIAGLAAGVMIGRAPLQGTCNNTTCPKTFACAGCQKCEPTEGPP